MSDGACEICRNWLVERFTEYGDGTRITNWKATDSKGMCGELKVETPADFGCKAFAEGHQHRERKFKNGEPWRHWVVGPCPDCSGRGSGASFDQAANFMHGTACNRCAGTGKVRHYDDGYVGEEQTRLHPKEKETHPPLTCSRCKTEVDAKWVACPFCGNKLDGVAETEFLGLGNAGAVGRSSVGDDKRSVLAQHIEDMNARNANPPAPEPAS